jgi:DHA2 family methylenomycin A resistance protein-like MFS transporter
MAEWIGARAFLHVASGPNLVSTNGSSRPKKTTLHDALVEAGAVWAQNVGYLILGEAGPPRAWTISGTGITVPVVKSTLAREEVRIKIESSGREGLSGPVRARYGLYAICFGFFLVLLDTTALNVAVVAMQRDFGGGMSGLQWVVNSYTIVFASFLLTCGAVGDRLGARRLYQTGLSLFTAMSVLCALSPGVGFLIGARMAQGLGAAIMLPASLSLLSHAFARPDERARAVAFWAGIVSLGFAAGPALGGLVTGYFGWRAIFWLNAPVGVAAILMVRAFVDETKVSNPRSIDWAGQAAVSLALFCLTYGIIEAGSMGWTAPRVLGGFGLAALLAGAFAFIERHSATPVLPRALFLNSTFSVCVAVGLVLNFCMYGTLFIESIYLQNIRHLTAVSAGLMILPFTVLPTVTTRVIAGYSGRRHIRSRLAAGQIVSATGAGILIGALWTPGVWAILLGLGLLGIGMGCVMPAMTAGVLAASPAQTSGLASGILNSARQVGGTLGVALMGTLVQDGRMRGYFWSFAVTVAGFSAMAVVTLRKIQDQSAAAR